MKSLLIKNALLYDESYKNLIKKDILCQQGKITKIADNIDQEENQIKVVDVKENILLPGLIDCHTHMGILEECTGKLGLDNNETSDPVTPHVRAVDAVNPNDLCFYDAIAAGITCVMITPGSNNPIAGQNVLIKTHGKVIDDMIMKDPHGMKFGFGEDPLSIYGTKDKCPVTRMGVAALIRENLMKAQDYIEKKEQGKVTERDIKLEALIPLLKGDIYFRAHAHRADDIVTAIRIAEEFNIKKIIIEHGTEAELILDYIKKKDIPIAVGPLLTPRIKMELKRRKYNQAMKLVDAGIKIGIMTDHPYNSIEHLRVVTALAVSEGLSIKEAMRAITLSPAEIMGVSDRVGSIKEGLDADLALYDGAPLDIVNSKVVMTVVNGEVVFIRKNYEHKVDIK